MSEDIKQSIKAYAQAVEDLQRELVKHHCSLAEVMPYTDKTAEEIDEITEMLVGITEELQSIKGNNPLGYPTQAHGSIPSFKNIEEERAFWDTHDMGDFEEIGGDEE